MQATLLAILSVSFFSGCTWRTKSAAHCIGPLLVQTGGVESNVCRVVHFPASLQIGRQCAVFAGWNAETFTLRTNVEPVCWRLRFWQVLPVAETPVFQSELLLGARWRAGREQNGLTAGWAIATDVRPDEDGLYLLSYHSRDPMATRFKFWRDVPANLDAILQNQKNKP